MSDPKYTMSINLNVLNHLGINLYSNIPAVLSEIVANSWDADAENVHVDFGDDKTITITDDGIGMTLEDINNKFLLVGHPKRENNNVLSIRHQRPYMGRKGIGKLSMFSIAKTIDVITRKDGIINAFRMNVDAITRAISGDGNSYNPDPIDVAEDVLSGDGTKIILRDLKKNISTATPEYIRKRIARRFSVIGTEYKFRVYVNGSEVSVEDRDYYGKLNYIWYYGDESSVFADYATSAEKKILRQNKITINGIEHVVRGWIGTVENSGSLKDNDDSLNKIVIIVRGKVGQENILDQYSEGGLYSKYLIGEIHADFFDADDQEDMATSSRQEYKRDDERFIALKEFIYGELKRIQSDWTEYRTESGVENAKKLNPLIGQWYDTLPRDDKKAAKKLLGKVNQTIVDDQKRATVLRYGLLAFEKLRYSHQLSLLENLDAGSIEALGSVITGFDDLEATLYYQIVRDRVEIIKCFNSLVDDDAKEKAVQKYLFDHLWLLDPSWERADSSEYMEKTVKNALGLNSERLTQDESIGRLDLGYRQTAGKHVIIELKRAGRKVTLPEILEQVMKYDSAIKKVLVDANKEPVYDIIVVLGQPVDGDNSVAHREQVAGALKAFHARVVYYTELINNAYAAYSDFLEQRRKAQPLIDILDRLAEEE